MQNVYSPVTIEDERRRTAGLPAADRPVGLLESIGLSIERSRAQEDWGWNQTRWGQNAFNHMREELRRRGHEIPGVGIGGIRDINYDELGNAARGNPALNTPEQRAAADAFWRALAEERARDPAFLPAFRDIADWTSLERWVAARRREAVDRIDREAAGGSTAGAFVGQIAGGFLDPSSYIPIGGQAARIGGAARRILSTAGREAAANVAVTAAMEPLVRQDAARLGIDRDVTDFLYDVGASAVTGAVIGGAFEGGAVAVERAIPIDRRIAAALRGAEIDPAMTPDEQAALHVTTREAEIAQASPFLPGPDGDDANVDWLDAAMRAMTREAPETGPPPPRPIRRGDVAADAADMSRVRRPAREALKARIRVAESGGDDGARNPRSSATGRYQFTAGTWLSYYRRRYGHRDSDAAALARRRDPAVQEVLMDDLTADNARALANAGLPETAGSLYLLHFAGEGGGLALLRAAPDAPVARLLGADAIRANPFLRGMTAADAIAWADRKMGEAAGATRGAPGAPAGAEAIPAPVMADIRFDAPPIAAMLGFGDGPQLRTDWFATPEEHARAQIRLNAARDALEGYASVRDDTEVDFDPIDFLQPLRDHAEARRPLRPEAIAEALRITPEQARRVAEVLAQAEGSPIVVASNGRIQRRPAPPERGPRSLLEFIAERGGIEDVAGDLAAMDAGLWHRAAPFRRRLLRDRSGNAERGVAESPDFGPDAVMAAAIEAGYFPQFKAQLDAGERLDFQIADLYEAIDRELRGAPIHAVNDLDEVIAEGLDGDRAELMQRIEDRAWEQEVMLDAATLDDALARVDAGQNIDEALRDAMDAAGFRDLADPAPETVLATPEPFDDPNGQAAKSQRESIVHDLLMMRDEESGAIEYSLGEEGGEVSLTALIREMEEERRAIEVMEACMAPPRMEAAE